MRQKVKASSFKIIFLGLREISRSQIPFYFINEGLGKSEIPFQISKITSKQTALGMSTWHVPISRRSFSDTLFKIFVALKVVGFGISFSSHLFPLFFVTQGSVLSPVFSFYCFTPTSSPYRNVAFTYKLMLP